MKKNYERIPFFDDDGNIIKCCENCQHQESPYNLNCKGCAKFSNWERLAFIDEEICWTFDNDTSVPFRFRGKTFTAKVAMIDLDKKEYGVYASYGQDLISFDKAKIKTKKYPPFIEVDIFKDNGARFMIDRRNINGNLIK